MRGLSAFIKGVSGGLVVFIGGLIFKKVFDVDMFSVIELAGFGVFFTLIFLLFSSIGAVDSKLEKASKLFPQLNLFALKKYADKWGDTYLGLKKIVLYEAPLTYPNIAGETIKYLLVFKFGKKAKDRYHHRRFEENNLGLPEWLFDKHFSEVYLDNPPANFVDHWNIITYIPEDVDPKYSVVLFKRKLQWRRCFISDSPSTLQVR